MATELEIACFFDAKPQPTRGPAENLSWKKKIPCTLTDVVQLENYPAISKAVSARWTFVFNLNLLFLRSSWAPNLKLIINRLGDRTSEKS